MPAAAVQQRSNRAAASDLDYFQTLTGTGSGWARTEYGDYYATAVSVYAAVKLRGRRPEPAAVACFSPHDRGRPDGCGTYPPGPAAV